MKGKHVEKTKRRRRRASPKPEPPPTCIEQFTELLNAALDAASVSPTHRIKIENHSLVTREKARAERADDLAAQQAENPDWESEVVLLEEQAQQRHVLQGHRGRHTKLPQRVLFGEFLEALDRSQADVQAMPQRIKTIVSALHTDLKDLDGRTKIADKQRAAVERGLTAMESMLAEFDQAAQLENRFRALVDDVRDRNRFALPPDRFEIVSVGGFHDGPDSRLKLCVQSVKAQIEAEQERLRVAGLHAEGKLSENEILQRDRSERYQYRMALQAQGKAFRQTPEGKRVWNLYKKAAGAYNAQAANTFTDAFRVAKEALREMQRRWNEAVCRFAKLEIRPELFPEI